jgi:hypothetical protein
MSYRVRGLDPEPFRHHFALDDKALAAAGARRVTADECPGYPCRVSLSDAAVGEQLILVSHPHMTVTGSPYRAAGPVFVRETATEATVTLNTLPPYLTLRLLSLRAYDGEGLMVDADVVEGVAAEPLIERFLANADVAFLHAHFARRGCFAAMIGRA